MISHAASFWCCPLLDGDGFDYARPLPTERSVAWAVLVALEAFPRPCSVDHMLRLPAALVACNEALQRLQDYVVFGALCPVEPTTRSCIERVLAGELRDAVTALRLHRTVHTVRVATGAQLNPEPLRRAVIDNLVKGASGQAIQNLNVMLGVPETTGLLQQALFP